MRLLVEVIVADHLNPYDVATSMCVAVDAELDQYDWANEGDETWACSGERIRLPEGD